MDTCLRTWINASSRLLLLIFWRREKPEQLEEIVPVETFYDALEAFLRQIEDKSIDDKSKAQLEMMLIGWWRDQLGYTGMEMRQVVREIGKDATAAPAFKKVQQWLHNPQNAVSVDELLASLRPYSVKPEGAA
ncbi:MAG: hypothetical protein ACI8W8_000580 [Rhodothermales bacterium]